MSTTTENTIEAPATTQVTSVKRGNTILPLIPTAFKRGKGDNKGKTYLSLRESNTENYLETHDFLGMELVLKMTNDFVNKFAQVINKDTAGDVAKTIEAFEKWEAKEMGKKEIAARLSELGKSLKELKVQGKVGSDEWNELQAELIELSMSV